MSSSSTLLRLDDTTLMFFPPQARPGGDLHEPAVVQVTMKRASSIPTYEDVDTYYDAQEEITAAVELLVLENLIKPLEKVIEVVGDGFMLFGEKKDWVYGRRLLLKWGDEEIRIGADKWVFHFKLC
ncbi:hypothetical protein C8R45DRAFT_255818 [Mycena sanguinolenta]|nr:hypothetical protein C8R45DRAFT_255818 [Mycena sanguinolenta]